VGSRCPARFCLAASTSRSVRYSRPRLTPLALSNLARAHAELGQWDDAWGCIGQAITVIETTGERWYEAEVHRIGGEIALLMPNPEAAKAEAYFERALAVARQQQAKSTARSDRVPSSGSFPLLPVSPASGATKANALRPAICSLRSTAGPAKASIRSI
jgi:Tetratricopeptide repeat